MSQSNLDVFLLACYKNQNPCYCGLLWFVSENMPTTAATALSQDRAVVIGEC